MTRETDCICPKRSCLQSLLSRLSCPSQTTTLSHATIARYTIHFSSLSSLSVSNTLPLPPPLHRGPFQYRALSQPLRTIRHPLSSIPSRPLPRPADRVRDETRRGQARGEATRHGTHGTGQTPTCGLRRRSSRHHHIPPNLGKATQLSAPQRQLQGIFNRLSRRSPPCASVHQPGQTLPHPGPPNLPGAYAIPGSSPVGSTCCTGGLSSLVSILRSCRAARLGTTERSQLRGRVALCVAVHVPDVPGAISNTATASSARTPRLPDRAATTPLHPPPPHSRRQLVQIPRSLPAIRTSKPPAARGHQPAPGSLWSPRWFRIPQTPTTQWA